MAEISFKSTTSELEDLHGKHQLIITLHGDFLMEMPIPSMAQVVNEIDADPELDVVSIEGDEAMQWDSALITFIQKIEGHCLRRKITFHSEGLPGGVERLLQLASAVPGRKERDKKTPPSFFERVGARSMAWFSGSTEALAFIGDAFTAFIRLITGRYTIRFSILFPIVKSCSADALPIVSLISALVGLILAFVGAVQLVMFGAQIYVASLVGIAMIRVMGAVMAGVIMAGRTGAAFAAQLGTMEVNEEIDALRTLGISPMEFLVMPRILSLAFLMPLLCLYADFMGILGGMAVGVFMLDLDVMAYFNMTRESVSLASFWIGLFQSFVFGILVAISGCLRGMQCKRSASAVGEAATSAVVTGIVSIVIATAIITVLCNILGI